MEIMSSQLIDLRLILMTKELISVGKMKLRHTYSNSYREDGSILLAFVSFFFLTIK